MTTKLLIDRDLLPCPFCGGDPEASPEYQHNPGCYFDVMASFKAAAQDLDFSLVPEVLKAWNRRAAPAPVQVVYEDTEEDIEQSEQAMRAKFEDWHKSRYPAAKIRKQNLLGTYTDAQVECNFETWMACIEFMGLNKGTRND